MSTSLSDAARGSAALPTHARARSPLQLIELTRFVADEVRAGSYPDVDFDEDERWHQRIYRDPRMDIWLIGWLPTQATELHDHGGSSGAFTVVSGELQEIVVSAGAARGRSLAATDSSGFGPHYVHDVANLGSAPAISVHAYSPPLTTMTYYDLDDGVLTPVRSLATDDPEPLGDRDGHTRQARPERSGELRTAS